MYRYPTVCRSAVVGCVGRLRYVLMLYRAVGVFGRLSPPSMGSKRLSGRYEMDNGRVIVHHQMKKKGRKGKYKITSKGNEAT